MAGLYWHFVDIVWIVIFTIVYLVGMSMSGNDHAHGSIKQYTILIVILAVVTFVEWQALPMIFTGGAR